MNKRKFIIIFLFVTGIMLITMSATYAFLSVRGVGSIITNVKSGSITLHYDEKDMNGILLTSAVPLNDEEGKRQDYFEFEVTADTANFDVSYVITAKVKTQEANIIPREYVNVYLTEVVDGVEQDRLFTTYYDLDDIEKNNHIEQEIYKATVTHDTVNYSKTFRLRIWINEYADYTPKVVNNETVYPMDDKEFSITINVHTDDRIQYVEPDGDYIRELCEGNKTYTQSMTYKIKTAEDLACFRKVINDSTYFVNANVILVANIDLEKPKSYFYKTGEKSTMYGDINEDGVVSDLRTEYTTGKGFKQISSINNYDKIYRGVFDGNNFTIKNLMINRPNETEVGLFSILNGTVRNLNIDNLKEKDDPDDDVLIIGSNNVGAIAGQNSGTIEKSHVYSNVLANSYAGGITGYNNGYVKTCWVKTKVKATTSNAGGVTGYISSGKVFEIEIDVDAYANNFVGGVTGGINGSGLTDNILIKKANVTGERLTGWIGGVNGNGIASNVIIESGTTNGQAFAYQGCTNCYYYSAFTAREDQVGKLLSNNKDINTYENPLDTWIGGDNDNTGYYFSEVDGEYHLVRIVDYPIEFSLQGSGTSDDPYLIHNTDEWNNSLLKVNKSGVYFKLVNDLDFTGKEFNKLGSPTNVFNGTLDGNNKTITGVNINGGAYQGIVGYTSSSAVIKDLTINNITINNSSKYAGAIVAFNQTTNISNVTINNVAVTNSYYAGAYFGENRSSFDLTAKNITSSNISVTGSGYIGLFAGNNTGSISNGTISGQISSTGENNGLFVGNNSGNITNINLSGKILASKSYTGGVTGQNTSATIKEVHIDVEINSTGSSVGGVVGYNNSTVKTCWVNAKVDTTGDYVGGITGSNYGTVEEIRANVNVHGNNFVGGITGNSTSTMIARNILLKSATVTGERLTGWIGGSNGNNKASNIFIETGSTNGQAFAYQGCNNCYYLASFTPRENQSTKLSSSYYNNLAKYDEILETAYDGDTNNTGYFFGYNENGVIDLVSENHETQPTEICTENCPDPSETQTLLSTGTGTCTGDDADTTAPTCTFVRSYPVSNGIAAEFYCSDESGAPQVASLFNSTTNATYSYQDILDRGSIKTGTVTGNTRNINSVWTTSYQLNQPQEGLCYYYQYGAKDSCGNWSSYVTKECYYGFSN